MNILKIAALNSLTLSASNFIAKFVVRFIECTMPTVLLVVFCEYAGAT